MSLHLGNLSSRVRIDELERVFQRFGRCSVRVKDRFGFVVYDFPGNAEKALRTLRGKRICGESVTISWSNRQPRPLQRTAKGGRSYESHHGRNSARENYVNRKLGSDGRRKFRMGFKQLDADGRRFSSADFPEEATTSYDQDNAKGYTSEKDQNAKEDLVDEGGGSKSIFLDNDRWEEQVGNLSNEDGIGFDRYEPYHVDGDDRRDTDEMNHAIHQGGSPVGKDSQDKRGIVKSGDATLNPPGPGIMKSKQTCYICGDFGHKMRNCPRGKDAERKKSRFDHRRDDKIKYSGKGEYELQRGGSKAQGSLRPGRNVMVRSHKSERDSSSSRKLRQLTKSGDSPVENETNRIHTNKNWEKKRIRRKNGSPEGQHAMKSRSSVLSPVHSDFTASKSKTKRSASRSNSPSRLRSRSLSSFSSSSTSRRTRSRKCKSGSRLRLRSRSRSKPRTRSRSRSSSATCLSLSASISRSLLFSPNKGQMEGGNSLVKAASPESKEISFVRGQLVERDAGSGNPKLENVMIAVENGSAAPYKVDEDVDKNHSQKKNDDNLAFSKDSAEEINICASQLKEADLTGGYLSPNSQRETRDPQNGDLSSSEHVLVTTQNPESEVVFRSHTVSSKSITSEEMHMALKHYGMQHQEENEKDLPVDTYFGSARLWPWEIIYFRRLRKGPISTENYARRIAQNEEFGIVDKYVRSSSGWGEREEHDS